MSTAPPGTDPLGSGRLGSAPPDAVGDDDVPGASAAPAGRVAIIGEALIDLIPTSPDTYVAYPGGSPANVAVGLARLGVPTRAVARISGDPFGVLLRERFRHDGVDVSAVVAAAEPSSLAFVQRGPGGSVVYDLRVSGTADWQWTDAELAAALTPDVVAVHVGSLAAVMPPGSAALERFLRKASGQATISYDPNCRPAAMESIPDALERIRALSALSDIVKVSDEDLAWLTPLEAPEEFAQRLLDTGTPLVVVTCGSRGAVVGSPAAGLLHVPAYHVEVVDTVGAGDSYTSALLTGLRDMGLLGSGRRANLCRIGADQLRAIADSAARAAAITCGRSGANPPTRADLEAFAPSLVT